MSGAIDKASEIVGDIIGTAVDIVDKLGFGLLMDSFSDMFAPEMPEMGDSFGLQIRENAPVRTLYGEDVVGGNIVGYGKVEANKKTYHVMHCVLINHPCESVELESINGQPAADFAGLYEQEIQLGNHSKASQLALQHCYNWTKDHIGYQQTMVTIKVEVNEDRLPNGVSDIRWKVKGKRVYDPRKDSSIGGVGSHRADDSATWEYSSNTILCALDHLRFAGYKTIPASKFDLVELMSESNICDETVKYKEAGVEKTEKRYTCNGMFEHTSGHSTVLNGILNSCNGRVRRGGGQISLRCGSYHGPALVVLTLDDASGPVKYNPWPTIANRLNSVRTSIIDPNKNYVKTALEPVVDKAHQESSGLKLDAEIKVPFARTAGLAKRLCNQAMAQANAGTMVFPTKKKGFLVHIGNTVQVSIPERGINKEFLIVKAEPKFNPEGDWEMNLYLREESPALYPDDFIPVTDAATPNTSLPDTTKPPAPTNLAVNLDAGSNLNNGVITWNVSTNLFDRFEITVNESGSVLYVDNSETTSYTLRNELSAGSYTVTIRTINRFGRYSDSSNISFDIALPAAPNIRFEVGNFELVISPYVNGLFLNTVYQAFIHTENNRDAARDLGVASQFTVLTQPDTTYYVWVKTINLAGESTFTHREVKTKNDASSIVDLIQEQLNLSLPPELRQKLDALRLDNVTQNKLLESIQRELEQNALDNLAQLADTATIDIKQSETKAIAASGIAQIIETNAALAAETENRAQALIQIKTTFEQSQASITSQLNTVSSELASEASKIVTLQTNVGNISANYASRSYVISQVNYAESNIVSTIDARFDENTGVYGRKIKTAVDAATAAASKAEQIAVHIVDSDGNIKQSFIDDLALVTIEANGETIAAAIKAFTVAAGGKTHTIEQIAQASISPDGSTFSSQFKIQTSLNGIKYGFGLYNTGSKTYFAISTNSMLFFDPATGDAATSPFVVENGIAFINEANIKSLSVEKLRGDVVLAASLPLLPFSFSGITGSERELISFTIPSDTFDREALIDAIPVQWHVNGGGLRIKVYVNNALKLSRSVKSWWHPSGYKLQIPKNQTSTIRITAAAFGGSAQIINATPNMLLVKSGSTTIRVN